MDWLWLPWSVRRPISPSVRSILTSRIMLIRWLSNGLPELVDWNNMKMKPKIQLEMLKNRIDLKRIPFSDRGSRILVMQHDNGLSIRLSERWFKLDHRLTSYRE